jgi:XXXCH domain-containing protein
MSQSKSHKNEIALVPAEAAEFLRRLAGQLEAGGAEFGEVTVETDGPVKIKQSFKTKSDKVSFKLKLKYETALTPDLNGALGALPEDDTEDAAEGLVDEQETDMAQASEATDEPDEEEKAEKSKASYKSLKKKMGKLYKSIKKAVAEDNMPSKEDIDAFAADCEEMTSFPGKGDKNYQNFLHHVGDMKEAAQKGDAEALVRAIAELSAIRKACHGEYK